MKRLIHVEKVFVPDFHTGEYVEAQEALYVIRQDMKTPMGGTASSPLETGGWPPR